jgi:FkbM family methyltransferase
MPASSRGDFFDAAAAYTPLVAAVTDDELKFIISTDDRSLGRNLFQRRVRPEMGMLGAAIEILDSLGVDRSGTFVDVGANIGTTIIPALVRHGFERGVAIEPSPPNASLLRANVAINNLNDRVWVIEAAASDSTGERWLYLSSKHGGHSVVERADGRKSGLRQTIEVHATTLDDLQLDRVGMLWMDVQGHEGHVLRGASRLLMNRPPIVLEVMPRKLERAGTLEHVFAVARRYSRFTLLHGSSRSPQPTDELPQALAHLIGRHTDIVLLP